MLDTFRIWERWHRMTKWHSYNSEILAPLPLLGIAFMSSGIWEFFIELWWTILLPMYEWLILQNIEELFFSHDAGGDYCIRPCFDFFFSLQYLHKNLRNCSDDFLETWRDLSTRVLRNIRRFRRKFIVQFSSYDFSKMNSFEYFGRPWRTVALSIGRSAAPRQPHARKSAVFNLSFLTRNAT